MSAWSRDGWTFWEPYADDHEGDWDHPGLWHVTTGARGVARAGRLFSRREIRAAKMYVTGLGGGRHGDIAPDKVSVTTRPDAALRLWRMISLAALAAQNKAPAWYVAWETMQTAGWDDAIEAANTAIEWRLDGNASDRGGLQREFELNRLKGRMADYYWGGTTPTTKAEARKLAAKMEKLWKSPTDKYAMLCGIETITTEMVHNVADEADAEQLPAPVGFTVPWHQFAHIDPRSVRVLRLEARVGAWTDPVPQEAELRFKPGDIRVVGVETMRGLVKLSEAPQRLRLGRRRQAR